MGIKRTETHNYHKWIYSAECSKCGSRFKFGKEDIKTEKVEKQKLFGGTFTGSEDSIECTNCGNKITRIERERAEKRCYDGGSCGNPM